MIQLSEITPEDSAARKAGYETICEIGEESLRRAGKRIRDDWRDKIGLFEQASKSQSLQSETALESKLSLDVGFRVFRVDSSNMKNAYYAPDALTKDDLLDYVSLVEEGRTPLDLLFQVMLELGAELSASIKSEKIAGLDVYSVDDDYILACFDADVSDEVVEAIARRKPQYAAFLDAGIKDDATLANFEQIFATYSPSTEWRIM